MPCIGFLVVQSSLSCQLHLLHGALGYVFKEELQNHCSRLDVFSFLLDICYVDPLEHNHAAEHQ